MDLMLTGDAKIDKALINLDKRISNLNIPGAPVINIYDPLAVTADYTFVNTDLVNIVYVTTGASDITITVPADINRQVSIMKVDSGAGKVIVSGSINGVSSIDIELQYRGISVASTGSALVIVGTIGECEIKTIGSALELVYTKILTGTHNIGTGYCAVAHGLPDKEKFVDLSCQVVADWGTWYWDGISGNWQIQHDATNVTFYTTDGNFGNAVKFTIKYYI